MKKREEFEEFIRGTNLHQVYSSSINDTLAEVVGSAFSQDNVDVKQLSGLASGEQGKLKMIRALMKFVDKLNENHPIRVKFKNIVSMEGMPYLEGDADKIAAIANGELNLSETQIGAILSAAKPEVKNTCGNAVSNIHKQCKTIASGGPFDNTTKADHYCGDSKNKDSSLLGLMFDVDTWKSLMDDAVLTSDKANIQQAMCFHHHALGAIGNNFKPSCAPHVLLAGYDVPRLAQEYFDQVAAPGEAKHPSDSEAAMAAYNNCHPFTPEALGDEFAPYPSDPFKVEEDKRAQVIYEYYKSGGENGGLTNDYVVAYSSSDGDVDGYVSRDLDSGVIGKRNIYDEIEENAKRNAANNAMDNDEVISEAESFYQSQAFNSLNQPYSINRVPGDETAGDQVNPEVADVPKSPQEITDALQNNQELLARIEELERKNSELFKQLQDRGVTEIEDADGKTVDINDAFNKTNERIQKQREEALKERERLQEALAKANNNFVNPTNQNNNNNFGSNNIAQNRPSNTPTPGGQVGSGNFSRNDGGILPSSSAGSVISGASNAGAPSGVVYGPLIGTPGLVLTQEALSLAKPVLQLNGKVLSESPELVKEAIAKVKSELSQHELELPVQKVDGVDVAEYILQEQDGRTVMVYLDGDKVVVREINVELEKEKIAQDAPQEVAPKKEEIEENPGRKVSAWDDVEGLLKESGAIE